VEARDFFGFLKKQILKEKMTVCKNKEITNRLLINFCANDSPKVTHKD